MAYRYCPSCGDEFQSWAQRCPDCGVELGEEQTEPPPKKVPPGQCAYLGLFDEPWWRDWTLWLAAVAIAAAVMGVMGSYRSPISGAFEIGDDFETAAFAIDLTVAVVVQFVLFGVLPAAIRRLVRRPGRRS